LKKADVVVVGGSAAGLTAAVTCRRHYSDKSVLLVRRENRVLIPCGIPYIFGTVGSPDKNLMADAVLEKNSIRFAVDEVSGIEPSEHILTCANTEKIGYEKLILATGSRPIVPQVPGVETKNIFVVNKDVAYLQQMLNQLDRSSHLVIVGGGFIGAEFADECRKKRNLNVTVVEMLPHCLMSNFDDELCEAAEAIARKQGIHILASERVASFVGNGKVEGVTLASGRQLEADMVILGIGCSANTELAEQAGLTMGPTGSVQVNRYMQTSDKDIFACGDCAEKFSFFDGRLSNHKLASIAATEARIAGANLFEKRRVNEGAIGVFSTVLGETAFAHAGLSKREAMERGYDVVVGEAEGPNRHPAAMPEMTTLRVRLLFEKASGVILGGQIMGAKCGGEVINTISACIRGKMTAEDISLFPMGTHPALTASPVGYQLTNAAEMAINAMR
jgi:pyruvate/2-oxoglutarate dehydrogenase complex dihydrolipoamide dehydrogenase (E3) component